MVLLQLETEPCNHQLPKLTKSTARMKIERVEHSKLKISSKAGTLCIVGCKYPFNGRSSPSAVKKEHEQNVCSTAN